MESFLKCIVVCRDLFPHRAERGLSERDGSPDQAKHGGVGRDGMGGAFFCFVPALPALGGGVLVFSWHSASQPVQPRSHTPPQFLSAEAGHTRRVRSTSVRAAE